MDWKRLIQFALSGSGDLEQYAILLVRVSIGLFFAISAKQIICTRRHQTCLRNAGSGPRASSSPDGLLRGRCGVRWRIPGGKWGLSSPACVALLIDMSVATLTSAISTLPKGLSPLNWLDDFLYLPEVLYVLFFIWLLCSGPGRFSLDYWLAGKLSS